MQKHDDVHEGLLDVSELSLGDLDGLDSSALVSAVEELLTPDRRDGEPVAGFTAYTD